MALRLHPTHMINDAKPDQFVFFFSLKYICTNPQMSQKTAPTAERVRFYYNRELLKDDRDWPVLSSRLIALFYRFSLARKGDG